MKSVKFFPLKIFRLYGIWSGFLIDYDMVLVFSMPVNLRSGEVESCTESDNIWHEISLLPPPVWDRVVSRDFIFKMNIKLNGSYKFGMAVDTSNVDKLLRIANSCIYSWKKLEQCMSNAVYVIVILGPLIRHSKYLIQHMLI